jgi:hypothetical protein
MSGPGPGKSNLRTVYYYCLNFLIILFRNLSSRYNEYVTRKEEERAKLQAFYADIKTQRGNFLIEFPLR